ncbi:MAG: hypothetical protein Q8K26_01835, partial [Candidatus Gracilibacteria bacterium]|nr:hypothetical protein [Candidatus Gracilibacteria bacterium]
METSFALNITSHASLQTNCDGGTFPPLVIYGTDTYHLWDYINTTREGIISGNSEVSVYVRNNKANIPNSWVQVSNYMPSAGQFYTVWNNGLAGLNIPALVPADRDVPVAQIVYRVRRMLTGVNNTYNFNGSYIYANFTSATPVQTSLGNLNKFFDTSTLTVDNECIAILPRWCGDSVLDSANGETCDFNDTSHTGWGVGGCDASCQPIAGGGGGASCIPGPTVGAQSAPVTVATVGICPVGQTVGDFTPTVAGSTTNYVWSCNGSPIGGSCSASYTPGGGGGGSTPPGGGGTPPGGGSTPPSGGAVTTPGSSSICGNGIVERPNAAGQYETCDTPASWCIDCTVTTTNPGAIPPGDLTITTPGSSPVNILNYNLIIGDGVPVFSPNDIISFRTNIPMYFQNKTATIT